MLKINSVFDFYLRNRYFLLSNRVSSSTTKSISEQTPKPWDAFRHSVLQLSSSLPPRDLNSGTRDWWGHRPSAKAAVCSQQCLSELLIMELDEHREEYPYRRRPRNSPEFWFSGQSFLKCSTEPQSLQPPPSRRTESLSLYHPDTVCITPMSNFRSSHRWWL